MRTAYTWCMHTRSDYPRLYVINHKWETGGGPPTRPRGALLRASAPGAATRFIGPRAFHSKPLHALFCAEPARSLISVCAHHTYSGTNDVRYFFFYLFFADFFGFCLFLCTGRFGNFCRCVLDGGLRFFSGWLHVCECFGVEVVVGFCWCWMVSNVFCFDVDWIKIIDF